MTWDEFDKLVREKMKENGIPEDTRIWVVEVFLPQGDEVRVFLDTGTDGEELFIVD